MKRICHMAFAYLKYYKKQTLALFLGIVLSSAMLTGIGSLLESGRKASMENAREVNGDWHYAIRCDYPWYSRFEEYKEGKGYRVERAGTLTIRKVLEEPGQIMLVYGDPDYLEMMGRKVDQGYYPREDHEAAMDRQALRNLGIPAVVGTRLELDGESFTLSGILSDGAQGEEIQVFVDQNLDYGENGKFLYLKFDESGRVYGQMEAFSKALGEEISSMGRNNELLDYVGGDSLASVWGVIKTGFTLEGAGLPYVWSVLNGIWNLTEKAVLAALALFGVFIIYSLFQMSVVKRMSQYSMMHAVGIGEKTTFGMLSGELLLIFMAGYPVGCVLGNGAAALLYRSSGQIFVPPTDYMVHTGAEQEAAALPGPGVFHVSFSTIWGGAVFFILLMLFIGWRVMRKMRNNTLREMMAGESGNKKKSRMIYSRKTANLPGVLTKKFMFARKGTLFGILFSLSIGSLIFLGTAYVAENTRTHNELAFKADDGLGSDIQVYQDTDSLADVIPADTKEQLENISELEEIHPVRYMLGEIPLLNGTFQWTFFYAEVAEEEGFEPNPELMEKYNGVAVKTGEGDYRLKVNIYGYDDEMLQELDGYLLEGEIDPQKMRKENTVIFKTLMDGQGNYDGINIKTGDKLTLKTPADVSGAGETLRFLGEDSEYRETEYQVAALVSRPLAKVDQSFIGDDGRNRVDIIMTNEQMEKNFGVKGYQTVSIRMKTEADPEKVSDQIRGTVSGIDGCIVKDYTQQIRDRNLFLTRKMVFLYGVALMLLVISILHIMNSMQYLVTARKHEFGILRAMGITDGGFRKMLLKEGIRYGLYSGVFMTVVYLILQKILYYFMVHVYLYIHPKTSLSVLPILLMAGINILICAAAVLISGRAILREQIIEEIK